MLKNPFLPRLLKTVQMQGGVTHPVDGYPGPSERLCSVSTGFLVRLGMRRVPASLMLEQRVENREELVHTRGEGHLGELPRGPQAQVKGPQHRVAPHRGQGAHVQHGPHRRPAAPDLAPAPEPAAVPIEGGHADQGGGGLVRQGPQFRQLREEGPRTTGPTPGALRRRSSWARQTGLVRMA